MPDYEDRPRLLDAGLTALALRGIHRPDADYPFLDRARSRRLRFWFSRGAPPVRRRSLAWWHRVLRWRPRATITGDSSRD